MGKEHGLGRPKGNNPKYRAVAEDIAGKIRSGTFPLGKPLPPLRALAKSYGVGVMTIRLAVKALDSDGAVRTTPHFRPLAGLGSSLGSTLQNAIAVMLPAVMLPAHHSPESCSARIYQGIMDEVFSRGIATVITLQHSRWHAEYPAGLRHLPIKGLLLLSCAFKPYLFQQYESLNAHFPVVSLDEPYRELHCVSVDNRTIIREATSRLIALGHRRIAFLRPYRTTAGLQHVDLDTHERAEFFTRTCQEAGLSPEEIKLFSFNTKLRVGYSATIRNLLGATPPFTAVLTTHPEYAEAVERQARLTNLQIPRDLSVVTICDAKTHWTGPLIDFHKMGRMGVDVVLSNPRRLRREKIAGIWNAGTTLEALPQSRDSI